MNLSVLFIRRPIGTSLLALGLFVAGVVCYGLLGVAALPEMQFPAIFVQASEAGADAKTMATTVTAPLERHLGQIPGIDIMRSMSAENTAQIFLMFRVGSNVDAAARQVQAAINAAQADLPAGLGSHPPSYEKANPNDDPILAFALSSQTQSARDLYDLADSVLAQRLRQLSGVAEVDISGAATPAVRIDLDLPALTAKGLKLDTVRNALVAANVTQPQGFLSDGQRTMAVTSNSALHSAEDFARLIIATGSDHAPIRLRDVAKVYEGTQDAFQAAWFGRRSAILMYVYKQSNANVIATVDHIKAMLPPLRTYLPAGTTLTPYFDGTPTIRSALGQVQLSLLISLSLVVLTMALFLRRLAPTVIAAVTVPLSLAAAIVAMYALGYTFNNLTLLALVIAIGFVVDDAIVVIENIIRHLDQGLSPRAAALRGTKEIGFTVVAITASLLAVFAPLLFAGGIVGMFFNAFAVTLVVAIAVSALVSLSLTPTLCGVFLTAARETAPATGLAARLESLQALGLRWYARALDFALHHRRLFALLPLLLIFCTFLLLGQLKTSLFPAQDTGLIRGRATAAATVSFANAEARVRRLIGMLLTDPDVAAVGARYGSSRRGSTASFDIQLKTHAEGRRQDTLAVLTRIGAKAAKYPDLNLRLRPIQDLPSGGSGSSQGGQYQIALQGDSLAELEAWMPRLIAKLAENPLFRDVGSDVDQSGLRRNIIIDRDHASRLGLGMGDIDSALYDAFGQRLVSTLYGQLNQYHAVINALPAQAASPAALDRLYWLGSDAKPIPLSAFSHQNTRLTPAQVTHEAQATTLNLSFNLAPGVSMGQALQAVRSTAAGIRLPGAIKINIGTDFRRFQQAQGGMVWLILGALVSVYIVLGMLYENLIHPLTILSTLPAAGVGALLALWITDTELSVIAQIALVLLIGIIKKNAIMMLDFALEAQRKHGKSAAAAIREACLVRFRPITMTSMVAALGALPLVLGMGQGADLHRPLGIAMLGGLLVSQALTLLSTPALYVVFSNLSQRLLQRWRGARSLARGT